MELNQYQFCIMFNKILFNIEKYLDHFNNKHDLDYEIINQMMLISFSKNNKIIISKQEIHKQIWLANKTNGYHFNYKNNHWICSKSNKNFWDILTESFYKHGNETVNFTKLYKQTYNQIL
ncbi:Iron-sulfur cluster assembly protein CyaY [Buchnera aphidicola (Pterocallis alni)]|uniref:iron donor protein CyaY n=1 Tax=Buchnera aphidicola TaxID=9 RepID=UPI0034647720